MKKILLFLAFLLMSIGVFGATATLPVDYSFSGGKSSLPTGIIQSGLGGDYAASNSPYRLKFDSNGDYIQIEVDAAAEIITIGIKEFATSGASIQVQGSTDGSSFTTIQTFSISNGQNKTSNHSTTNTISSSYRYFRIKRNSGSNFGLGTLSITKASSTPSYTITAQSNNTSYGTVSLSGNVITGSPNSGYQYADPAYIIVTGTASVSQSGNDFTVTPSSNCTIQINFEAIPLTAYTVTYDANGGAGSMTDSNSPYISGSNVTTLTNTFTREGYTFTGWNTQSNGKGNSYNENSTFIINSNTTLYAQWQIISNCEGDYYDFSFTEIGSVGWISDYKEHIIVYTNDSIIFTSADKQGSTITDIPVTKGSDIIVKARDDKKISSINLTCRQWRTNTQTITLYYSTDGGSTYNSTNVTSNNFTISYSSFNVNTNTIKFTFSSQNNQIGIESLCIEHNECENTITINKFQTENGSFDLSTTTVCGDGDGGEVEIINIVPDDGYMIDTILAVDTVNMSIVGTTNMAEHKITGIKTNCVVVAVFKQLPPKPEIDVVEWNPDYIKIDIDNFDAVTAVIENKNTQETHADNVATELFFSKYFEAGGDNKLLAIFNGTKDTLPLSEYYIQKGVSSPVTFQLSDYGKLKGYISPNEEIIFARFDKTTSAKPCADTISSFENWVAYTVGDATPSYFGNTFDFGGRASLGLFRNGKLIDVIGAHNNGILTYINNTCSYAKKNGLNDAPGWYGYGDNIKTDEIETDYFLSTNRCCLVRKNTVHNGENAVRKNILTIQDGCNDTVPMTFKTLSEEWAGYHIGNGKNDDALTDSTCTGLAYIGHYDYSNYYAQYTQVGDEILLGQTEPDGTYKINIQDLDTLSCTYLKVIVSDNSNKSEECEYKIPIFVSNTVTSTAKLFTKEGSDCPECDVIILNGGKLTISGEFTSRDITVYPGGVLIIPENAVYNVNSLTLRRDNNEVPYFSYKGILNFSDKFNVDLRTDANEWRWMALPFSHKVSDIRYPNGKKPLLNSEMYVSYYDGKYRSINKKSAWKDIETEKSNKTINNLFAWGGNNPDLAPNHKGWNLIGNPFMDSDTTDIIDPIRIGTLKKDSINGHWTGGWNVDSITTKLRYAVIPSKDPEDIDAGGYKSVVLDDYVLQPLTSFFVQIGGNESDMKEITFKPEKRLNRIIAKTVSNDEEDEETFLRVKVGKWKTGCFISNKFNDTYEPGDDLESRYPIYQTIGGYKLLYSAINDSIIENGVKVISPNGILHLDQKVNTKDFEYIYVNYDNNWFNLLNGETVDISNGEFILQAKRRKLNVTTDINSVIPKNKTFKFSDGRHIYINSNNSIYTVLGIKLK